MASSAKRAALSLALALVLSACAFAEDTSGRWVDVEFPHDSPVLFVSFSLGSTTARVLRASMALDLHTSLQLRNTGSKTICGLTLRVEAEDLTPSGKGSVTVPSLNVQPGEVFPVRIDMELLRPLNVLKNEGALVQVTLDCALFSDLSYYGPDKLDSRRALTVYELEARRDRRYLAGLLETGRLAQLREELNFGLQDRSPPQLGLELLRGPTSGPKGEQAVNVGAVLFPSSPVQAMGGAARVFGNQVRAPRVEVKNRSRKAVRTIEMGWIVRDERGRDFVAGSVPASMQLAPVQTGILTEPGMLRVSRATGQPLLIGAVMAFVDNVEFADGNLWIPSRRDITEATNDLVLRRALAASPEQQRLAEIYRKKGINALAAELKRVN
ncbi:MAG: hypothetical protein ACR2JB_06805 [Bryobacteraceae bacterium]